MTKQEPKVDLKSDKRKQSVYFPVDMLDEIQREALRKIERYRGLSNAHGKLLAMKSCSIPRLTTLRRTRWATS